MIICFQTMSLNRITGTLSVLITSLLYLCSLYFISNRPVPMVQWQGDGFVIWMKRLEQGSFTSPRQSARLSLFKESQKNKKSGKNQNTGRVNGVFDIAKMEFSAGIWLFEGKIQNRSQDSKLRYFQKRGLCIENSA